MIDYVICEFLRDGVIINKGHIDCESFKQETLQFLDFTILCQSVLNLLLTFKSQLFIYFYW